MTSFRNEEKLQYLNLVKEIQKEFKNNKKNEELWRILEKYMKVFDVLSYSHSKEVLVLNGKILEMESENQILKDEKQMLEMRLRVSEQRINELQATVFNVEEVKLKECRKKIDELKKSLILEQQRAELKSREVKLKH